MDGRKCYVKDLSRFQSASVDGPLNSGYAWKLPGVNTTSEPIPNKTLGRSQDPRANGAWLSKLTE